MRIILLVFFAIQLISLSAHASQLPRLSDHGIGQLDSQTAFDLGVIAALFPKLTVSEQERFSEGEAFPVVVVRDDKGVLFTVYPSAEPSAGARSIGGVFEISQRLPSDFGLEGAAVFGTIYDSARGFSCAPGREERSGTVSCLAPGASSVYFIFTGDWNGLDGIVPPTRILESWLLTEIVWQPRR